MTRLDSIQRQIRGLTTKIESGAKLGELRQSFCEEALERLCELKDLVIQEEKDTGQRPEVAPMILP